MPVLREYQERAILLLREHIKHGLKKVIMALPTGGGKSIIFGQIIANALDKGKTVLWLVHRRNLVYQMRDVLEQFGIECGLIMAGNESDTKLPIQLGTIQTYNRRLDLDATYNNRFYINADLILIDEGHRSLSKTYMDVISLYHDKIIISCTATPMRADGRGMGEVYDSIVDIAGVCELTTQGYLSPVRYFAPSTPDLQGVKVAMGDYVVKQLDKKINKTKLNGDIVENWLKHGEDRQTLVFCVNVKHSIAIRNEFIKRGISAEHLDARSSDTDRDDVFRRMENGDTKVICNVGLYQEGLDVPSVSCISIARPTKSMGLYRQMCGRGMRPVEGKDNLKIFDHGGVIEEHGFLEDEILWNLNGKEIAWKKAKKRDGEPKLCKCKVCHEIFIGTKICPKCGTELKSFGKKIEATDDELVELKKKKKNNKVYSLADKRRIMGMLVYMQNDKGWNPGRKKHLYREIFNVWPVNLKGVSAIKPEGELSNMVKYAIIKSAMKYKKMKSQRIDGN